LVNHPIKAEITGIRIRVIFMNGKLKTL